MNPEETIETSPSSHVHLLELFLKDSRQPTLRREIGEELWSAIEAGGIKRWRKGDPASAAVRRLLIGMVNWSRYDVELAQSLIDWRSTLLETPVIEFFNVDDVLDMRDFERYIPGIGEVYQTPVIGLWEQGILVKKGVGVAARKIIDEVIRCYCSPGKPAIVLATQETSEPPTSASNSTASAKPARPRRS